MKERNPEDWTTIGVKKDTHSKLEGMKIVKSPGRLENFDDVIRRKMDMDTPEEQP